MGAIKSHPNGFAKLRASLSRIGEDPERGAEKHIKNQYSVRNPLPPFINEEIFMIELVDKIRLIADYYGFESQSKMLVEEMAELIKEISKCWRGNENTLFISSEIADVEIMITQIKYLLGLDRDVENWKNVKVERQLNRMECSCNGSL